VYVIDSRRRRWKEVRTTDLLRHCLDSFLRRRNNQDSNGVSSITNIRFWLGNDKTSLFWFCCAFFFWLIEVPTRLACTTGYKLSSQSTTFVYCSLNNIPPKQCREITQRPWPWWLQLQWLLGWRHWQRPPSRCWPKSGMMEHFALPHASSIY